MMKVQTSLEFKDKFDHKHYTKDGISVLTRMFVDIDPITNKKELRLYTDDGRGNGVQIFKADLE